MQSSKKTLSLSSNLSTPTNINLIIMDNRIYEMSDEDFKSLIRNSSNKAEVLFKLGYSVEGNSWGYGLLKKRMEELGLDGTEFKGRSNTINNFGTLPVTEDILCENSSTTRAVVRKFILKNNLIPYKCSICGISEWEGKPLSLQLDHINGKNNDHRLENLRWLCPNCHSQTETYGSKNSEYLESRKKLEKLSEDEVEMIKESYNRLKNQKLVVKETGFSARTVKEIIDKFKLSPKSINQLYVIRYDLDGNELARYGSVNEMCQAIIDNNEVKTKIVKTCRNTFNRNKDKVWLNSIWKLIDPHEI